jgi:hypothetical protein
MVHYGDGLLERLLQAAYEQPAGLGGRHATDVSAGDGHAVGDAILARGVVRECRDGPADQEQEEGRHEDEPSVPHAGICA